MKCSLRWSITVLAVLALSTAGVASAGVFSAEGSFERTLQVTGPVELEVTTGSGSIAVRTGEAATVHVRGTIRARKGWLGLGKDPEEKVRALEANPPIEQNGNVIRIGRIEDRELRRHVSISYELVVPVETRLRSSSGSGDQTIAGLRGPVKASTGSGDIKMSNIGAEVEADTGSGDIELNSIKGNVSADTSSGSIRASGIAGGLSADTGSGNVTLQQSAPGTVKIDTGSGSVEVRGVRGSLRAETGSGSITAEGEPTGNWNLSAGSGNIHVRLPAEVGFDFHARTGSGSINTDHPVTVQGAVRRNDLRGKVRGGGPMVNLETGSGNIRIE